jgi:MFS family permease
MDEAPTEPTAPRGRTAPLTLLRRNRDFRLLFAALLVSFAGDWFLFVALAGLVFDLTGSPALVAALFASTTVPFALFTFVGGPLADRLDRRLLMVAADVARGFLALGFFLIRDASLVWLVFVLAGGIAALGALFQPASSAATPNLVDREDLPAANVLTGATWGTMLAVGAALGGLVVAAFGREVGYAADALSFFVSALLVLGIRRPMAEPSERHEHPGLAEATREAFRFARRDRRVMALLTVKGGVGFSAGMVGLLPVLALDVFRAGDRGTGILLACRGVGVVLAPFLIRRLMRGDDLRPLFLAIPVAFVVYGSFYAGAAWAPTLATAGVLVAVAHLGGGAHWTLSTYALQLIVPDHVRGRIFAFDYGLVTFTIALSATVGGYVVQLLDVRSVMFAMAGLAVAYAVIWFAATSRLRAAAPSPH